MRFVHHSVSRPAARANCAADGKRPSRPGPPKIDTKHTSTPLTHATTDIRTTGHCASVLAYRSTAYEATTGQPKTPGTSYCGKAFGANWLNRGTPCSTV
eukprot:887500-Prymnesium_polylepis.3